VVVGFNEISCDMIDKTVLPLDQTGLQTPIGYKGKRRLMVT